MQRTKGASATELVTMVASLEKQVQDMMLILAAVAYIQDDKMFSVSIEDIKRLPPGSSIDFSYNKKLDQYEFAYVPPKEEPTAGLILPISADGEKAAELVRASVPTDH
jgi:hypothetical protein